VDAGAQAILVQHVHHSPDAYSWAIVTPAVVERVRDKLSGSRFDTDRRLAHFVVLDVETYPEGHASTIGPL